MRPGRKPGFTHSAETREKIRQSKLGRTLDQETKQKIGETIRQRLAKVPRPPEYRDQMSEIRVDYEGRCLRRLEELKGEYPEQGAFFEEYREELLFAMEDVRSEKELNFLRTRVEATNADGNLPYVYPSSSVYSAEDLMIALLDAKKQMEKSGSVA